MDGIVPREALEVTTSYDRPPGAPYRLKIGWDRPHSSTACG